MSRKILIIGGSLVVAAVLVLVVLGIWLGSMLMGRNGTESAISPYSVVYLSDGEVYFGKLSWFPKPHLSDPWTLQRSVDKSNNVQTSLVEVSKSAWSPSNELYLNEKSIMAWSSLLSDGNMAKLLANPASFQQQQQAAQGTTPTSGQPSTGTFNGPTTQPPAAK
ncbi:MAG TPA: hypothetical protein VMV71_04015 [Candidatus Paceibacterota bacterium]|nr:hypothetical protein [Candidatus Paceibacterota bacterium]